MARRGIAIPVLYAPQARLGLDSRITIWTATTGFTFRPADLEQGPILIPEHGVFVTKAGTGQTARQFARELAARKLKSIRQMTREHREAASLDEALQEVRLWTCPTGTVAPPFPQVEDPPMQVQLPDARWTDGLACGLIPVERQDTCGEDWRLKWAGSPMKWNSSACTPRRTRSTSIF